MLQIIQKKTTTKIRKQKIVAEISIKELKALWKTATFGMVDSTNFN